MEEINYSTQEWHHFKYNTESIMSQVSQHLIGSRGPKESMKGLRTLIFLRRVSLGYKSSKEENNFALHIATVMTLFIIVGKCV